LAQENEDGQEKTEDPTQERRDEFREKGEIAVSRDLSSVAVLAACIAMLSFTGADLIQQLKFMLVHNFRLLENPRLTVENVIAFLSAIGVVFLKLVIPIFSVTIAVATATTLAQTRLSFSMNRIAPNFQRFNPIQGLARLVSVQALVELSKGVSKLSAVAFVSFLILRSEWRKVPSLMNVYITNTWAYWGQITKNLFWSVGGLLLLIASADYLYSFISLENKMKMTKKEIKEDYKKREADPIVRNRMRRMQREVANRKTVQNTKKATVVITNPTHYSIAIKYELGMDAPLVVAKGIDFIALQMREVAKEMDIPIVENRPLARTLYKMAEVDQPIPESLYKAISEVIRYVFKIKGIKINRTTAPKRAV
jgi:flagellar biosynthetic protein FlhB